ncbi:hypothetical protein Tco_0962326 [Tanacetum coccineum]
MVKSWLVQDQTVLGKDYSNLLIADSLLKTIWFINAPCYGNEALASPKANELTIPEQTATGKGTSNPLMAGSLPKTTKPTDILNICPRIQGQEFDEPLTEEELYLLSVNLVILKRSSNHLDVLFDFQEFKSYGNLYTEEYAFVALVWEDLAYQIDNIDFKKQDKIHADTQVYGAILSQAMTNQALLDSVAYKTYFAIAAGAEPPRSRKSQNKSYSTISSKESPSKKNSAKAKKVAIVEPKPIKKKTMVKADRGKSDGTNFESGVPDEQHRNSGEEDEDDENDSEDKSDDGDNDDNGNDGYDNDDDVTRFIKQNVSQESRFEQVEEDAHVTLTLVLDTQKADEPVQSSSVSSDFTGKLLNLENLSPADNEIASLMETSARHVMAVPEITSVFTITIPQPPLFFNPLSQQATPTPTPTTFEATTSFPLLPDFSSIFKFNKRVTNLEKFVRIKQVDQLLKLFLHSCY